MPILIALLLIAAIVLYRIFRDPSKKQGPVEPWHPVSKRSGPDQVELLSDRRARYYTTPPPLLPKNIPQPFDYQAEWWINYSRWYRDQKGWRCEECQIALNGDRYFLHTHHIWGTRHNELKDLKALCIGCHAEQPSENHRALRHNKDYSHFMRKYGKQWRLYRRLNIDNANLTNP